MIWSMTLFLQEPYDAFDHAKTRTKQARKRNPQTSPALQSRTTRAISSVEMPTGSYNEWMKSLSARRHSPSVDNALESTT